MPLYRNIDGTTPDKGLTDVLKWQIGRRVAAKRRDPAGYATPRRVNDGRVLASLTPSLTWIGHATFVQRLGGKLMATDPIWSRNIQLLVPRFADPGVAFADVPRLDVVTVSHAHYDHMDLPTLKRIGGETRFVVPRDNGAVLRKAGLPHVVELDWWETHREGDLAITLVPAQHWSMRFPWDRNERLWGGFVYESPEGTSYHAGDTAFSEDVFRAIGERFPRIDWAMLPIGAYDPPWFMQPQHMGPEEAGRAFDLLGARSLCAMHWGTFRLTDEPMSEPPERLRSWWQTRGHDPSRLWLFDIGETRTLAR
jgi:L-ascorbate metabolism protein UlaG (beta-lactamase superfamily)